MHMIIKKAFSFSPFLLLLQFYHPSFCPLFTFPYIRYALYVLGCHCEKGGNPILQGGVHSEVPRDYRLVPHLIFSKKHMSHSNIFVLATLHCMVCNKWLDGAYFKVLYLTRCLQITEKVSFNIASEAS